VTNGEWEDYFNSISALEDSDDNFALILQNTFDLKPNKGGSMSP
jgi:hypothetical protein